jgi:uncharacterized protein (DUF488 family)
MDNKMQKMIWTLGHSTRTIYEFVAILKSFHINALVDIRSFPGSKRFPHFNKENLELSLPKYDINYFHLINLGGRRKPKPDSKNIAWRNASFRGYADYMETDLFKNEIEKLEQLAEKERTAYMCSEAVWWRCHRSMVSDYLKMRGWMVMHIMDMEKAQEHPYTKPARIENGGLFYDKSEGELQF